MQRVHQLIMQALLKQLSIRLHQNVSRCFNVTPFLQLTAVSITHTIFALDSCFSNYPAKTAHFKTLRDKDDDTTKQSVQAKLDAYLDQAARYRDNMIQLEREKLEEEAKKHSGYTGDKESSNLFVQRKGAEAQAKFIISNPPTADVADHLHKLIDKSSDPRGSTFSTKVHGNMSGRGNSASKQRGELTQVCPVQRHFTGCRVTRGRT